jgi:hypothetical protein
MKMPRTETTSIKKETLPNFFQLSVSTGFAALAEIKYEMVAIIEATKERITRK